MEIKAVIFDFGGVIFRTEDPSPRSELAKEYGMTRADLEMLVFNSPTAIQAAIGKRTAIEHWKEVAQVMNYPLEDLSSLQNRFFGGDRLDTQLVDFLRKQRHSRQTGLLSNAWDDLRLYIGEKLNILDAFDQVIISAEVRLIKPDPQIYGYTTDQFGVLPGEAVFVDDMHENVEGAKIAGLHAIRFQSTTQTLRELQKLLGVD